LGTLFPLPAPERLRRFEEREDVGDAGDSLTGLDWAVWTVELLGGPSVDTVGAGFGGRADLLLLGPLRERLGRPREGLLGDDIGCRTQQLVIIIINLLYLLVLLPGVRVRRADGHKKEPAQPEWPKQDRKILRRCMSRSPYKPQSPPADRVAVLWRASTAHKPGAMKGPVPSR
jgi:hypothetical protein